MLYELSPIQPVDRSPRRGFASPTGTYYMTSLPTPELADDLITAGIERLVLSAVPDESWPKVAMILENGGIKVEFHTLEVA